jgi:hypothetical protein
VVISFSTSEPRTRASIGVSTGFTEIFTKIMIHKRGNLRLCVADRGGRPLSSSEWPVSDSDKKRLGARPGDSAESVRGLRWLQGRDFVICAFRLHDGGENIAGFAG